MGVPILAPFEADVACPSARVDTRHARLWRARIGGASVAHRWSPGGRPLALAGRLDAYTGARRKASTIRDRTVLSRQLQQALIRVKISGTQCQRPTTSGRRSRCTAVAEVCPMWAVTGGGRDLVDLRQAGIGNRSAGACQPAWPDRSRRALAAARALRVSFTLAHQYLGQLTGEMAATLDANAHNEVYFALSPDDAVRCARYVKPYLDGGDLIRPRRFRSRAPAGRARRDQFTLPPSTPWRYPRPSRAVRSGFARRPEPVWTATTARRSPTGGPSPSLRHRPARTSTTVVGCRRIGGWGFTGSSTASSNDRFVPLGRDVVFRACCGCRPPTYCIRTSRQPTSRG